MEARATWHGNTVPQKVHGPSTGLRRIAPGCRRAFTTAGRCALVLLGGSRWGMLMTRRGAPRRAVPLVRFEHPGSHAPFG